MSSVPSDSVAIIGLAIRAPGASDAREFFSNLCAPVDSISRFTREQQTARGVPVEILNDSRYVAAGGVLDDIDLFDASLFGMSRREAELTDPQQRIFLEVVWKALEDAGVNPFAPDLLAGLFAGCSLSRYLMLHAAPYVDAIGSVANLLALAGNDKDHIATRTAYLLNLRGPCVNVQSSCSTSLVATHLACQSLLAQECDVAIAGAVSIQLPQGFGYFHEPGGITSPDGFCRPFDELASGTVFGSGAGAVVLRRANDALADGDRIYALVRGSAIYNDGGKKVGYTAPAHDGQVRTVATALAASGVEPASISYVECHGTGTALGDPVEIAALRDAFGPGLRENSCWIGSVKGNIGHLECASGIAGLIKTALALFNETLPPSLHFSSPNAGIPFAHSPFQVVKERRPWRRNDTTRRAGVHSIGMGGTNAHLVLEEAPPGVTSSRPADSVLYLSARGIDALRDLAASYERFLRQQNMDSWFAICGASRARTPRLSERLAVFASSCSEAAEQLRQWRERDLAPGKYLGSPLSAAEAKKVAQMVRGEDQREAPAPYMALPTYPLRREHYWIDPIPAARTRRANGHMVLGERRLNPKSSSVVFESKLSKYAPDWAQHHIVDGVSTLPAAAFIEMALAAARHYRSDVHWSVFNAEFLKPLFLGDDDLTVQNHVEPRSDDTASWELFSLSGAEWHLHARCRLAPARETGHEPMVQFPSLNETGDALYARAAQAGVDYSGVFRAIRSWKANGGQSWALISLPPGTSVKEYGIHPALLDASWQCAGALLPKGTDLWVPAGLGRITIFREGCAQAYCQAELFNSDAGWKADIRCWTEDGALAVETGGLCFRRLRSGPKCQEWIYEPVWEEQPAALRDVANSLSRRAAELEKELPLSGLENLGETTEFASALFAWRAFRDMGVNLAPGARICVRTICEPRGVLPQYERLVKRLLVLLEQRGWIRRCTDDDGYTVVSPPNEDPIIYSHREASRYPAVAAQWNLLTRCGESLPNILRGDQDPLHLLFGQDDGAVDIYESSPVSRLLNSLLAESVHACTAAGGVNRVLEIGAGTGASTRAILPLLHSSVKYCFTDISPTMVEAARSAIPGIQYAVFDISKDPIAQGLEGGEFDLVVSSHVLHATPDLRQTLSNIRRLIRPGGRLLLLETVAAQAWLDITFGLTSGWWNSTDVELRGGYPLLGLDAWVSLLGEQFIPAVAATPEATALLLAEVPGATTFWYLLGNTTETNGLAAELEGAGDRVEIAGNIHELSALPRGAVVVDLTPLKPLGERVPERVRILCRNTLCVVQKIATEARAGITYLFTLTRCAHRIDGREQEGDPAAAAIWGMSQSFRQEIASLKSTCIDLPASISWSDVAAELRESIRTLGAEGRIALRGGRRFVQRVRPAKRFKPQSNWCLEYGEGGLDSLRLTERERRTPSEGEVEIQVAAAGLNFRDVLRVTGAYPSAAGLLGGECSGIVTDVGPSVTGIAKGDSVVAAAEGSLAGLVIAKASLTAAKPVNLSWETAAGIPIAWMTAALALEEIAKLSSGETILIHAGTGGVGSAAIEIARAAGVHVLATAGTEEKRRFLRESGVHAAFDSRNNCFRDGVLAATKGKGVNAVLNCLGGDLIRAGFDVLAPGGCFLELGRIDIWGKDQARTYRSDVRYEVIALDQFMRREPGRAGLMLQHLLKRISSGEQHIPPFHVFPPVETSSAFRLMRQARHIGKVVILTSPAGRFEARPHAAYLVTGGTRGLGLRTAQWLIERGARNIVLASRHTDGSPGLAKALREMLAQGARVELRAVDTSDCRSISDLVRWIDRKMPPLAGVIHAAGVLLDHSVVAFPWADFEKVLQTKIEAAWELHDKLDKRPLDFFVCYSSAGSLLGAAGQTNHAAANAFLDSLCQFRRAGGKPGLAVNWGAWSEIGSASSPQLAARLASQGISRIDPESGLAALEALLCGGPPQALVLPADWPAYFALEPNPPRILERLRRRPDSPRMDGKGPAQGLPNLREQLRRLTQRERRSRLVDFIRTEAASVLGSPSRPPAPDEPLGDSGLDSLMAIELRGRLGAATGLMLPIALLFDYPTAEALAFYLASEMNIEISSAETARVYSRNEEERIAALLRQELRETETI